MAATKKMFGSVFAVSALGSLPIGTLNTSVANYCLKGDISAAIEFALAAILVETIVARLAVLLLDRIYHMAKLFSVLSIVLCGVLYYLAFKTLLAAFHMKDLEDALPFVNSQPFLSGLTLSFLNPLHLPFWMAWTAVFRKKHLLNGAKHEIYTYIIAIAAGTALGFLVYGLAGNALMTTLKAYHHLINWVLGFTLLLTAVLQSYKLIVKAVRLAGWRGKKVQAN